MSQIHYQALSALLCYPEQELLDALPEIRSALSTQPALLQAVEPLLTHLSGGDLIALQEAYVATFDRNPAHSLHLFEHIHGEDRARGQAMVDLMEEYKTHGFEMSSEELPDYVPLFLEFLSQCEPDVASPLLGDAVHVLHHVAGKEHAAQRVDRRDQGGSQQQQPTRKDSNAPGRQPAPAPCYLPLVCHSPGIESS